MFGLPLHPSVVHVPLGVAAVLPLVLAVLAWGIGRRGWPRATWWIGAGLALLVAGAAFVALRSGEAEEETVEKVVPEKAIEEHEEAAKTFLGAAIATAVLAVAGGLLKPAKVAGGLRLATLVVSAVALGLGMRAGHEGGKLVFQHGAGAAYSSPGTPGPTEPGRRKGMDDDD